MHKPKLEIFHYKHSSYKRLSYEVLERWLLDHPMPVSKEAVCELAKSSFDWMHGLRTLDCRGIPRAGFSMLECMVGLAQDSAAPLLVTVWGEQSLDGAERMIHKVGCFSYLKSDMCITDPLGVDAALVTGIDPQEVLRRSGLSLTQNQVLTKSDAHEKILLKILKTSCARPKK